MIDSSNMKGSKVTKNNDSIICGIGRVVIEKSFCKSIKYLECSDRVRGTFSYQ